MSTKYHSIDRRYKQNSLFTEKICTRILWILLHFILILSVAQTLRIFFTMCSSSSLLFFQCHACTHHFNNSRFVALCVSFFFFFPFFDLAYPPVTQNMCKRKDDASTYTHSTYIRKSGDRTKHQRDNNEQTYSHICSKQVEAFVLYALRTNTDTVSISIRTNTGLVNEEKK